jgi:hypothetical protein
MVQIGPEKLDYRTVGFQAGPRILNAISAEQPDGQCSVISKYPSLRLHGEMPHSSRAGL